MKMLIQFGRLILAMTLFLLVAGGVGYFAASGWRRPSTPKAGPGEYRVRLVREWVTLALRDIRDSREGFTRAALFHFANDPTDFVTDAMRAALEESGYLALIDPPAREQAERWLNLEVDSPASLRDAFRRATDLKVGLVVFGRVLAFEGTSQGSKFHVQLVLGDPNTGKVVLDRTYSSEWKPSQIGAVLSQVSQPPVVTSLGAAHRVALWWLAVLLLPVCTIGFLRAVVRRESNGANFGTFVVYTAVDGALAFLLLGLSLEAGWSGLVFLGLLTGAAAYNLWLMSVALRFEK